MRPSIDGKPLRPALPTTLPLLPMASTVLLPGCRLPLKIFEPRFVQLAEDALHGHRMVGVIQPIDPEDEALEPRLHGVGCAGRIASFREDDEGHYRLVLVGVSRFEIVREVWSDRLYRVARVSWARFAADRRRHAPAAIDREELVAHLRAYFQTRGLEANWPAIEESGNEELVNSLAMVCPFEDSEKQALLEAPGVLERSRLVIALMNMAVLHDRRSDRVH